MTESPKLFVVATPLGHLGDITYRAVGTLKNSSVILCEDKRVTLTLLRHYEIDTPLRTYNSYQEGNKEKLEKRLAELFEMFPTISLVSDAGTPCISDPGYVIVNFCRRRHIPVLPIPGPSAAVTCLSVSGFQVTNSLFYGFLPNKKGRRKNLLKHLLESEKKVIVFYESPYRLKHTLEMLLELNEDIKIFIGREMTKKFEEFIGGTAKEALNWLSNSQIRGEFVVIWDNSN